MKNIQVSKKILKILREIKNKQNFKHFNQVVKWLIQQAYCIDKKTITQEYRNYNKKRLSTSSNNESNNIIPFVKDDSNDNKTSRYNKSHSQRIINKMGNTKYNQYLNFKHSIYKDKLRNKFFHDEKTGYYSQIKCNWCGGINIKPRFENLRYITCILCNRKIRL
jgi:hypothetical protein